MEKSERIKCVPYYEELFTGDIDVRKKPSKVLTKIYKKNWLKIVWVNILYIIKTMSIYIMPLVTANVINAVTYKDDNTFAIIITNALLLAFLIIINVPLNILYSKCADKMLRNISAGLRNTLVKKLQHLSITYHKELQTGKIQSKFIRDMESIEFFNVHFVKTIIRLVFEILFFFTISLIRSRTVAVFFLIIIPINVIIVRISNKRIRKDQHNIRKANEVLSSKITTMIDMISVTKAHGMEEKEINSLEKDINHLKDTAFTVDVNISKYGSVFYAIGELLRVSCLLYTVYLAYQGTIAVGDIVIFTSYFASISSGIQALLNLYPELSKGLESVRSISEIMLSDSVENNYGKARVRKVDGAVCFKNVSYRYPRGDKDVIKNFTLDVKPGECIAFVGASGSGKSTLMNMIIGFLPPTEGTLTIDGTPLTDMHLSQYRNHIAVVPQSSILFNGSIKDNILYGVPPVSEKDFQKVLDMANITEFLPSLPNGVDSDVGEKGDKLSGGQKQRISIARALIRNPQILILDEATSALDNISEYHVQKAISSLIKNRTTFIVAHRLSTIRDADKIVVMDNGRIAEMGTYDELMEKKGQFYKLKQLNEIQAKAYEID